LALAEPVGLIFTIVIFGAWLFSEKLWRSGLQERLAVCQISTAVFVINIANNIKENKFVASDSAYC